MWTAARWACGAAAGCGLAAATGSGPTTPPSSSTVVASDWNVSDLLRTIAFRPNFFKPFVLRESIPVSKDTAVFRFDLPPAFYHTGLTVASCVIVRQQVAPGGAGGLGVWLVRPYTPITLDHVHGYFDLLVKKYPHGQMSSYIFSLKPGDTLQVRGPFTKIPYVANQYRHLGMIAGGTGITPMYQVIQEVLRDPEDRTEVDLIYANRSPADILLKKQLDSLAQRHRNFRVHYTVDNAPWWWRGERGRVTEDMVRKYFPAAPRIDSFVYVCGPRGMVANMAGPKTPEFHQGPLEGVLKACEYSSEEVYKF